MDLDFIGCDACGAEATSRCKGCKAAHYCSKTCQHADWADGHAETCGATVTETGEDDQEDIGLPISLRLRARGSFAKLAIEHVELTVEYAKTVKSDRQPSVEALYANAEKWAQKVPDGTLRSELRNILKAHIRMVGAYVRAKAAQTAYEVDRLATLLQGTMAEQWMGIWSRIAGKNSDSAQDRAFRARVIQDMRNHVTDTASYVQDIMLGVSTRRSIDVAKTGAGRMGAYLDDNVPGI